MSPSAETAIPYIRASEGPQKIHTAMLKAGGVVIEGFITPQTVAQLNKDIDCPLEKLQKGSTNELESLQQFHGRQTKRLTNLVTLSKAFRDEVLDKDLLHDILKIVFAEDNESYWMSAAQAIEIHPGNAAQVLHRDQAQFRVFDLLGCDGPEAVVNFLIALTDFTEENGATRVIPGSHLWPDYSSMGAPEQTLPARMKAGDVFFMSGKTVHGGGANRTANVKRRGLALAFSCSYLTPEESYPFMINVETAKSMSQRAQQAIGFRSQYPKNSGGLWQIDYGEIAGKIGL
jgi:ectoine hydroxylase-related dioxygenase (phytanoyl-CoA dioxygenase family)